MNNSKSFGNRFIQIKDGVIGPVPPRPISLVKKTIGAYPGTAQAYLDVAEIYASKELRGPGICDELMELIQHMFSEEEAALVRHIKPSARNCTAASIAASEHRPVEEVREILERLSLEKRILVGAGKGDKRLYFVIPILPGAFETVLVNTSLDKLTDWHRRFAELFVKLFETGFTGTTKRSKDALIRYLPVGQSIEVDSMALPSDKLEEIFAPFETYAVGLCQCRIAEEVVGRNCGRPMEVCVTMGPLAKHTIQLGRMRSVELKEVLEIKAEAEATGLVTWTMNVDANPSSSNTSCSCCGCCCHFMRRMNEFSMPAAILPPHFLPVHYSNKCSLCGKCALACPMGAIAVGVEAKTYQHNKERCIGCGQCAVACSKEKAIKMDAVPKYQAPTSSGSILDLMRSKST